MTLTWSYLVWSQKCMIITVANEANKCNSMFKSVFKFLELFPHIFTSPVGYFWSVIHEGMFCFYILHAYFLNMPKGAKSLPNSLQKRKNSAVDCFTFSALCHVLCTHWWRNSDTLISVKAQICNFVNPESVTNLEICKCWIRLVIINDINLQSITEGHSKIDDQPTDMKDHIKSGNQKAESCNDMNNLW